jgi:hypothetical protein
VDRSEAVRRSGEGYRIRADRREGRALRRRAKDYALSTPPQIPHVSSTYFSLSLFLPFFFRVTASSVPLGAARGLITADTGLSTFKARTRRTVAIRLTIGA